MATREMARDSLRQLFDRVRGATPESVKRLARNSVGRWASARIDPRLRPGFLWRIRGGLIDGLQMDVGGPSHHHMVATPYEPTVQAALSRLIRPGAVCADIGAHIGYMSLVMAKLAGPSGCVIAFEPDDSNAKLLERNVSLNGGIAAVTVVRAAVTVGGRHMAHLFVGTAASQHSLVRERHHESFGRPVAAVSLDDFFSREPVPDVVKIDVEGAEEQVLRGMKRILETARPAIVLEVHGVVGWPAFGVLRDSRYTLRDLYGRPFDTAKRRNEICHVVAIAQ
jgi:FkbM family methyltransferase